MKKLAIIIPTKGKIDLLVSLLNSIVYQSKYDRSYLKIYIADTGSSDKEKELIKYYLKRLKNEENLDCIFIEYDFYNFAKINNDVIKNHVDKDTELILLCNNDIELINDAISMVVKEFDEETGTIGARLMFKNNLVQHCGIFLSKGLPGHLFYKKPFPKKHNGKVIRAFGNTGAFMLTSKKLWDEIGGLNEEYKRCFEDVEYNLTCLSKGYKNKTVLDAVCWHCESATRRKNPLKEDIVKLLVFYKKLLLEKTKNKDNKI